MYRTVIISVPSTVGLIFLVLLFGAAAGYVVVAKKLMTQAKHQKQSTFNSTESPSPDLNKDTNKLLSAA